MRRLHAIAISLLLGAGIAAGAAAALRTAHLGAAAAATRATIPETTIVARRAKLAKWSASLEKARTAQPPTLPRVPHYAPVPIPTMPPIQRVVAAAQPTQAPPVEQPAPTPRKEPSKTAEQQVTYVQPPPIVQYQQAPAPPTATTTTSGEHESSDDDHVGSSGEDGGSTTGQSSGSQPSGGESGGEREGDG